MGSTCCRTNLKIRYVGVYNNFHNWTLFPLLVDIWQLGTRPLNKFIAINTYCYQHYSLLVFIAIYSSLFIHRYLFIAIYLYIDWYLLIEIYWLRFIDWDLLIEIYSLLFIHCYLFIAIYSLLFILCYLFIAIYSLLSTRKLVSIWKYRKRWMLQHTLYSMTTNHPNNNVFNQCLEARFRNTACKTWCPCVNKSQAIATHLSDQVSLHERLLMLNRNQLSSTSLQFG